MKTGWAKQKQVAIVRRVESSGVGEIVTIKPSVPYRRERPWNNEIPCTYAKRFFVCLIAKKSRLSAINHFEQSQSPMPKRGNKRHPIQILAVTMIKN